LVWAWNWGALLNPFWGGLLRIGLKGQPSWLPKNYLGPGLLTPFLEKGFYFT